MTTISGNNTGSLEVNSVPKSTTSVLESSSVTSTGNSIITTQTWTVGEQAYMYMRAKTITFTAQGLKPNTQYYAFFDRVYVGDYCSTQAGQQTSRLVTNSLGDLVGNFYLPSNIFTVGTHKFELVDSYVVDQSGAFVADPLYGSATAFYEANGVLKQQQTQVTETIVDTGTKQVDTNNTNINLTPTKPQPVNQVSTPETTTTPTSPLTPIKAPQPELCEEWQFVFQIGQLESKTINISTSSSTQPLVSSLNLPPEAIVSSIQYNGASPQGKQFVHTFAYNLSSRKQQTVTWVGKSNQNRPDLATFRPSGIKGNSVVTIITPWTKVRDTVCPVKLGAQVTTKVDPLAQSFFVDPATYPAGMFVTSINVYFKTVDKSTPVFLELRTMSNGTPASTILPGGVVIVPGYAVAQSNNATVPTQFKFDQPIYLKPNTDYCFVLKSSSLGYNAWTSRVGEVDVTTGRVIDAQPFLGTLFKSENDTTWLPDSYEDLKFDFNVAQFRTSITGDLIVKPQLDTSTNNYYGTAQNLPLSYISTTAGSSFVNIKAPMHGLEDGDKVFITGIATPDPVTGYNNILASQLQGEFIVDVIDGDTIQIQTVGNTATRTGSLIIQDTFGLIDTTPSVTGNSSQYNQTPNVYNDDNFSPTTSPDKVALPTRPSVPVIVSSGTFTIYTNVYVNEAMIDYLGTELDGTNISEFVRIATGKSVEGDEIPYSMGSYIEVEKDGNFYSFNEPRLVASPRNETLRATELTNRPSATLNLKLQSTNKDVSPIIDTRGLSLMVRSYKINNQLGEIGNVLSASAIEVGSPVTIVEAGDTNFVSLGANSNNPGESFVAVAPGSGTGTVWINSEVIPGQGNAISKYKGQIVRTASFYNKVTLFVTANCPEPAYIDAYVRTSTDDFTHMDRNWEWVPINGVFGTPFRHSADKLVTNEWMYVYETPDSFNVYDIKLVMRSTNNSIVPKIYGIRTITDFA